MESRSEAPLMDEPELAAQEVVIDELESEKMEVLNENASTATLNMQNFDNSEYQHREDIAIAGAACDGTFEAIAVETDVTTGPITALIQQDGQFLQVDSICDDSDMYCTTGNGQSLTYIGRSYEQSAEKSTGQTSLLNPKDSTISTANAVKTKLVPTPTSYDSQTFQTVTVTLLNENEADPTQTKYILLVSNDGEGANADSPGDVISITEHKAAASTPSTSEWSNSLIFAQQESRSIQTGACSFCDYKTTQRHLLHKHIRTHSEERPHKCHICGNGFKTYGALNNHVNTHSGKRPHKCRCCESAFTTSGELIRHIRYKHTFEKPHKCSLCNYASVELSKMKRHMRTHTGERPYQCSQCSYASPDSYKLKRHMRTHTGEKPYACDLCTLKFTQSNSLKAHRRIHLGSKPVFQCELCPATCGRKTDLRIHMQKLHGQETVPLECKKCHKSFESRYDYKLHIKTHDGERTFKCGLCAFASLTERKLAEHLVVGVQHENYKPYKCAEEKCEAAFRFKSLLRRHQIFVHGLEQFHPNRKEFKCSCGKRFAFQSNQLKHHEMHAGTVAPPTVLSILQDIENIDDIGEELVVELTEEILLSNPTAKGELQTAMMSSSSSTVTRQKKDVNSEHRVHKQKIDGLPTEDNLVMRRIVKEVKGHRVVVMEVGPSELSDEEGIHEQSIIEDCHESRLSGESAFGASISQDAAVQILYNLAAEGQLTVDHHSPDISDHREHTELTSSLSASDRVVSLEMDVLPDNVMSESVPEVTDENVLEDNDDERNLEQISLSVQAASTTLMQLKRSAMEQQVEEQKLDTKGQFERPRMIDENDDIHG